MPFVVDASVAACWLLPDEGDPRAAEAYSRFPDDTALVPSLWWFEIRNIFVINERRKQIEASFTNRALALLAGLPIQRDDRPDGAAILALARRYGLTAYDATYLELAQREGIALATLDADLLRAAHNAGVPVVGEAQ